MEMKIFLMEPWRSLEKLGERKGNLGRKKSLYLYIRTRIIPV